MLPLLVVALVALGLALASIVGELVNGARGPRDPQGSSEAAVRAFVAATTSRQVDRMCALAIAPERLARAIECRPNDRNITIVEAVKAARDAMHDRSVAKVRIKSIVEVFHRNVAVGGHYGRYRAIEPFEWRRLRVELMIEQDCRVADKFEEVDAILVDGCWWLVIPSPYV